MADNMAVNAHGGKQGGVITTIMVANMAAHIHGAQHGGQYSWRPTWGTQGGQHGVQYSWRPTWRPILKAAYLAVHENVPLFPVHLLHDEAVVGEEDPPAHVLLQLSSL